MVSGPDYEQRIAQAVDAIRARWPESPRIGMVLGTGAGQIAQAIVTEERWPYSALPHFPTSTAIGHSGELVCGRWHDTSIVAMRGRIHLYEGHSLNDIAMPIHVMHRLGVQRLLVCNAAGGVNPKFRVGDLMLIDSHIDLFFRPYDFLPSNGGFSVDQRGNVRADASCDRSILDDAERLGRQLNLPIHRGVYVGLLGPSYETRAEYRMCRRLGGDAVGMSTIPEIVIASSYGIPILAVSIITNTAAGNVNSVTSGHAVLATAEQAAHGLRKIFENMLGD
jgi:purine-nucleoside phosphorylase